MHPFQKYLGWVQRYFYHVEHGELPAPTLSLSIDQDWPLTIKRSTSSYVTVAGTVSTTIYEADAEHHGLVFAAHLFRETAGVFPLNDAWAMHLEVGNTEAIRLLQIDAGNFTPDFLPLVGGLWMPSSTALRGVDPVYVPPSSRLILAQTSAAGGINGGTLAMVLERWRSYPLRLP